MIRYERGTLGDEVERLWKPALNTGQIALHTSFPSLNFELRLLSEDALFMACTRYMCSIADLPKFATVWLHALHATLNEIQYLCSLCSCDLSCCSLLTLGTGTRSLIDVQRRRTPCRVPAHVGSRARLRLPCPTVCARTLPYRAYTAVTSYLEVAGVCPGLTSVHLFSLSGPRAALIRRNPSATLDPGKLVCADDVRSQSQQHYVCL